jgi:hypothetical protein
MEHTMCKNIVLYIETQSNRDKRIFCSYGSGAHPTIKKLGTSITIKKLKLIWVVRAMPRLCELYPGICLTTEEKAWKNFS